MTQNSRPYAGTRIDAPGKDLRAMASAIAQSFIWCQTPEGNKFWDEVSEKLHQIAFEQEMRELGLVEREL